MEIYLRIKKENHQFLTRSYCFIITFIVVFYIKLSITSVTSWQAQVTFQ